MGGYQHSVCGQRAQAWAVTVVDTVTETGWIVVQIANELRPTATAPRGVSRQ